MGVEELLPPAFTHFNEVWWGWELFHKGPGCWQCPIIESLQGCRVILIKGLLELVDEGWCMISAGRAEGWSG